MFESCAIIGDKQFQVAKGLFSAQMAGVGTPLIASAAHANVAATTAASQVDFVQTYVNFPGLNVTDPDSGKQLGTLCMASMGQSFAAGTTDGSVTTFSFPWGFLLTHTSL